MINSATKLVVTWFDLSRENLDSYEWRGKKQRDVELDGGFSPGSSQGD